MLLVLKVISVHGNFAKDFTEDYKMINQNTATVTAAATKTQDATQTQKPFANDAVRKLVEGFSSKDDARKVENVLERKCWTLRAMQLQVQELYMDFGLVTQNCADTMGISDPGEAVCSKNLSDLFRRASTLDSQLV